MTFVQTGRQISKTLKNAARLKTIVGVFARHGFHNFIERTPLRRLYLKKNPLEQIEMARYTIAERVRMSFEELGPSFVKLGQLLSTRPDLIPDDFVEEFKKLQDQVQGLAFTEIRQVIKEETGKELEELFLSFDQTPLAAASIAQVHKAKLLSGEDVVVKVQRPGIQEVIKDDLGVLQQLAELLKKYVPETQPYNPIGIYEEFRRTILQETNFVVEANNIRRFYENFRNEPDICIPRVYMQLVSKRMLVLEFLDGIPLSQPRALEQLGLDRETVVRHALKAYLKMVFKDALFHGDMHAGNFLILPNSRVGLIDFGMVGRLSRKVQNSIASMLVALSTEDYERLANEYVELAPFSEEVDVDRFASEMRNLIAPYYGLTLQDVNPGRLLMDSASIAARHHLVVPAELILFFRSIINVEAIGKQIKKDFDFLSFSMEFASDLVRDRYEPAKMAKDLNSLLREATALFYGFPNQLRFLLRKMSSPDHAFKLEIRRIEELRKTVEKSFNLLFLGILIASLLLSSSLILALNAGPRVNEVPVAATIGFILTFVLSIIAFVNYLRR